MTYSLISYQRIFPVMLIASLGFSNACSKEQDSKEEAAEKVTEPNEDVPSDKPVVTLTSGMPEFCNILEVDGVTCLRCVPRDIPILKCSDKKSTIVPEESCTYDAKALTCIDSETEVDLMLEFSKHSVKEKYYVNLDQLIVGIKFVVGATMKNEGEDDRILLYSILDSTVKHKKDLFLGTNTDAVVDEMVAAIAKKDANFTPERKELTRINIKNAVEIMSNDIDEKVEGSAGLMLFVTRLVEAVQVGNENTAIGNIKINKLIETMNSPKYKGMIDELLNGLGSQ